MGRTTADIKLADEVWIATALLHRDQPDAADFSIKEIEARLAREGLSDKRPGVYLYLSNHAVANRPRDRGRYRILVETAPARRRLFRPGDPFHPSREGGQTVPDRAAIPPKYHPLLDWYEREWSVASAPRDPLLDLAARHRAIWKGTGGDDYVRRLREGFE
jgi:hypothetical protein